MTNADCGLRIADWRVVALLGALCVIGSRAPAQTSLSIYRDGRVLVRRSFAEPLRQGRNEITVTADGLDPATLFSLDPSVTLTSAVARYPTTPELALGRAVGQTLAFARERDTVRATVVRVNPPQVRLADGRMLLAWPGTPLFPEALVRTATQADVVLDAARGRPRAELAFVGQGMTWEAVYQVVLAGGSAAVTGAATVTSQGMRVDTAEVQLVAGSIRRARRGAGAAFEAPALRVQGVMAAEADAYADEETVGEAHVYSLPGLVTIEPGVPVATSLFPRASTSVSQEFIVPGALPWRGYVGAEQNQTRTAPVQSWYTLRRGRGSPFGDRPLPGGTVQLYQADAEARLQLIGESAIDHTPAGRDLRVQAGDAFDLTAERVQTEYSVEQVPPARRGLPATQRVTASYRVTLTSAKAEAVTIDVREVHAGEWRVTASSTRAEKLSASEVRFRVPLPANGTATLTYTVQIES
jgi:hypothetical protein